MPELPEVETSCRGIRPHLVGQHFRDVIVRQPKLRYPIPALADCLVGHRIDAVFRRGKYLLVAAGEGHLLIHLGMSGSLRLVAAAEVPGKHDHIDWQLSSGMALRFTDPRRFGVVDWLTGDPARHRLLARLGPEPLADDFSADYLHRRARGRQVPIKSFIMDSTVVVGVGNIYANEALFMAGILPLGKAGQLSRARCESLVAAIKSVLAAAIEQGGTTLRDFVGGDGKPGYFKQSLSVYGRGGLPCVRCGNPLQDVRLAQRATVFCSRCQR